MSYLGNAPGVSSQRTVTREIVAVASKTAFVPVSGYALGYVDVYVNGLQLDDTDFTATDGVNITLATAALSGDLVRIVAWLPRGLSDGYLKAEADAKYVALTGDQTIAGVKTLSSNPILSGGTANGIAYLNGSKVLTTGSALQFDGTNLGLGVTPSAWGSNFRTLELAGGALWSDNSVVGANVGLFKNAYYDTNSYTAKYKASYAAFGYTQDAGGHKWFTAPSGTAGNAISFTQAMTLDTSGNLIVGVTTAYATFTVKANSSANGISILGRSSDNIGVLNFLNANGTNVAAIYNNANALVIDVNSAERARIDSSGNLLVGSASSPSGIWSSARTFAYVKGSAVNNSGEVIIESNNGNQQLSLFASGTSAEIGLWSTKANAILFANNNTERARIDTSGNLLINTTSQLTSGRLCIADDLRSVNPIVLKDTQTAAYSGIGYILFNNASNSMAGYITHNGSTSVAYTSASDYRLKKDVQRMTGALAKVALLNPCTYKWIEDDAHGEGFIAHELAEVCPIAVHGEKDAVNEDGSIRAQAIDTSFLVATLTAAIQEQQALIAQLQADVQTLKEAA